MDWLRRAAEAGHPQSQVQCALLLQTGHTAGGLAKNLPLAAEFLRKGAEAGCAVCHLDYGLALLEGKGVPVAGLYKLNPVAYRIPIA
jgi:TPR repeat protein